MPPTGVNPEDTERHRTCEHTACTCETGSDVFCSQACSAAEAATAGPSHGPCACGHEACAGTLALRDLPA